MTLVDVAALGDCYRTTNRVTESHQVLATELAGLEAKIGKAGPIPPVAFVRCQFGLTLLREGRFAEAEAVLRQSLADYDRYEMRPLNLRLHPRQRAVSGLGQALAGQGKFAEAEPLVVQAFQELQANAPRLAGNAPGMVREALDAVIALYTGWAESDPSKKPIVAAWRMRLEEFEAKHTRQEDRPAHKT